MTAHDDLLILDTHVWIWLMEGSERLPQSVRKRIERGVPTESLRVSAISVWETAMLESKGRVGFGEDCMAWVNRALAAPGVFLSPLTPEIAVASTRLPGQLHGDPADRIIVATARSTGATLVTADVNLLAYGRTGHLRVLTAA